MNLLSHIPTCKRYYKSSAKTLVISFIGFQTQKVDVKSNVPDSESGCQIKCKCCFEK